MSHVRHARVVRPRPRSQFDKGQSTVLTEERRGTVSKTATLQNILNRLCNMVLVLKQTFRESNGVGFEPWYMLGDSLNRLQFQLASMKLVLFTDPETPVRARLQLGYEGIEGEWSGLDDQWRRLEALDGLRERSLIPELLQELRQRVDELPQVLQQAHEDRPQDCMTYPHNPTAFLQGPTICGGNLQGTDSGPSSSQFPLSLQPSAHKGHASPLKASASTGRKSTKPPNRATKNIAQVEEMGPRSASPATPEAPTSPALLGWGSAEESDTDWISVSDETEKYIEIQIMHRWNIPDVLDVVFKEYSSWRQNTQHTDTPGNQQDINDEIPPQNCQSKSSKAKRRREDDPSENSSGTSVVNKRRKIPHEQRMQLACPFWKIKGQEHIKCFRYKLTRIRDVKQHIHRCHQPPCRCPRCGDVFPTEEHRDCHARADPVCAVRIFSDSDISPGKLKALTKRSNPTLSMEEQWYGIWDILFPGIERPSSPFIDSSLSEDLCQFREFFEQRGPSIIRQALQDDLGGTGQSAIFHDEPDHLDAMLRAGLQTIAGEWLAARSRDEEYVLDDGGRSTTISPAEQLDIPNTNSDVVSFGGRSSADLGGATPLTFGVIQDYASTGSHCQGHEPEDWMSKFMGNPLIGLDEWHEAFHGQ